jgi:hypothetical protein
VRYLDTSLAGEALARPGADTRGWFSYGTVEPETAGQPSVTFSPAYGPLVNVKLHPSGVSVVCRVAHAHAGNGEADWMPFVQYDEVLVGIPEGDEKAGCCILGRCNQEIDAFPTLVAGQDPTKNNFGFRRTRVPFIFETQAGYLVRNATTGAFLSISDVGAITLAANSGKDFLALTADFLGLQNAASDCLIQIALEDKQVVLEAAGTKLVLDAKLSSLYTTGVLQLGTSGNQAADHATSVEAVANLLAAFLSVLGVASTTGGPTGAAGLATALIAFNTPVLAQTAVAAMVATAAGLPLNPALQSAIAAGLAGTRVPGSVPGLGAAGLLI